MLFRWGSSLSFPTSHRRALYWSVLIRLFLACFYATLYYLPTYFQIVRGTSAIRSGVLLLPLVTVQTIVSFGAGMLQSKTGDYWYNFTIGFAIWTIGLGLLSSIDENTSLAKLIGYEILDGIGAGQTFQVSRSKTSGFT